MEPTSPATDTWQERRSDVVTRAGDRADERWASRIDSGSVRPSTHVSAHQSSGTRSAGEPGGVAIASREPRELASGEAGSDERPLVLVADDDPDVLELVVGRMKAMGYEVLAARDGEEALELAMESRPGIAILDVAMPRMDGLEVTRRLRARSWGRQIAIILMTARVADADVVRGFEAGAAEYIKKPFSLRELTEAVKRKQEDRDLRRREADTRRLADEQAALRRVATSVAAEALPREVFAQVAEEAGRALEADVGTVLRLGDTPEAARVVGVWATAEGLGPEPGSLVALPAGGSDELAGLAQAAGALVEDPRAVAVAPVRLGGHLWGAVAVASAEGALALHAGDSLHRFADLVALALANTDARNELATLASVDDLTGLLNQRTFKERLSAEVDIARRKGRPLSLAILDLDHFKQVNDTHGHAVGDQVLAEVARRLAASARAGEALARVGGEEFAWILPSTTGAGAHAAAERARRAIASRPFPVVGRLTVSAGVCALGGPAQNAEDLFRLADVALYWAKNRGRDLCLRYSPESARVFSSEASIAGREREHSLAGIRALARTVDAKSPTTRGHSERVAGIATLLALACGWTREETALLRETALVHDVGKIGLPDTVLLKPGPLSAGEREQIAAHPVVGAQIVAGVLLDEQARWLRHHHERYDGRGYPDGLSGEGIPLGARLLAIADAWDAMTTNRPYRVARSLDEALAECRREKSAHFCPVAVEALGRLWKAGELSRPAPSGG